MNNEDDDRVKMPDYMMKLPINKTHRILTKQQQDNDETGLIATRLRFFPDNRSEEQRDALVTLSNTEKRVEVLVTLVDKECEYTEKIIMMTGPRRPFYDDDEHAMFFVSMGTAKDFLDGDPETSFAFPVIHEEIAMDAFEQMMPKDLREQAVATVTGRLAGSE